MKVEQITKEEFDAMCTIEDDNYFQNGCIFDDNDNLLAFAEVVEQQTVPGVGGKFEYYKLVRVDDWLAEVLPE